MSYRPAPLHGRKVWCVECDRKLTDSSYLDRKGRRLCVELDVDYCVWSDTGKETRDAVQTGR